MWTYAASDSLEEKNIALIILANLIDNCINTFFMIFESK